MNFAFVIFPFTLTVVCVVTYEAFLPRSKLDVVVGVAGKTFRGA